MNRRHFLKTATSGAAVGLLASCSSQAETPANAGQQPRSTDVLSAGTTHRSDPTSALYPFRSQHQAGVLAPPSNHAVAAAFDLGATDQSELQDLFLTLSRTCEHLMSGEPFEVRDGGFPPADTGLLGPVPGPTGTAVVIGFGASLFDDRFGLMSRSPTQLRPMDRFANDQMVTSEASDGDLMVLITADNRDAAVHALRQIMRDARGALRPRWVQMGNNTPIKDRVTGGAPMRNLLGFKDGTANPDASDSAAMSKVVWVQGDDDEPAWTVDGTYLVVRVIRTLTEFWDRTRLSEQERIFGRRRDTGAPLGKAGELDEPEFGTHQDSHIARANPRTAGSDRNLILRKGYNYVGGLDSNGQLDQGLLFTCFQRRLDDGFVAVQRRLDGEALEEYIRPVGGGYFFVPPAPRGREFLGEALFS